MHRVVKIDVDGIGTGTGLLISLDDKKEDVILTVCHIFGKIEGNEWVMLDVKPEDVRVTSRYYNQEFEVTNILYLEGDALEKDVALVYVKKISTNIDEDNPLLPWDEQVVFDKKNKVYIEGFAREESNSSTRVIEGNVYDYSDSGEKFYRLNYLEKDRAESVTTVDMNKGMSGAPAYIVLNNKMTLFIGIQKSGPCIESTDGIVYILTYKHCLKLVKELYNVELPLINQVGKLLSNEALFNNIHIIRHNLKIATNTKEHFGASIEFDDVIELREDFIFELVDTIIEWMYSEEKYEEIKENIIKKGKSSRAADSEIRRNIREKFRDDEETEIKSQGQIAELILFHFIQYFFKAVPMLRKENILNKEVSENTLSNVIHYKKQNEKNIIVFGQARSFCSSCSLKDVFSKSLDSIMTTYINMRKEIRLYMSEDFLDKDMIEVAQSYKNRTMKVDKTCLVSLIMYNENEKLKYTSEEQIKQQIDNIIKERYEQFKQYMVDKKDDKNILSKVIYILFPIWNIEELVKLFRKYL